MPKGGIVQIHQDVAEETLNTLAKVNEMLEAEDIAYAVRFNKPYALSALSVKVKKVIANLSAALLETLVLEEKAEPEDNTL